MADNINDDAYVANLLKKDAMTAKKKYELVGIDAFNPKRMKSGAPKANTNFLRRIIRQTDNHNAALLARESEESNARLKRMDQERESGLGRADFVRKRRAEGRLTPAQSDRESYRSPRKRRADDEDSADTRGKRYRRADRPIYTFLREFKDLSRDGWRDKREHEGSDEDQSTRRSRNDRDRRHHHQHSSDEEHNRARDHHKTDRRYKSRRTSSDHPSRSRSPIPGERNRRRSPSHSRNGLSREHKSERKPSSGPRKTKRRSTTPASDSDPLEAIVGPLPPPGPPKVRSRGRGAHNSNAMGIDSRFSFPVYDPILDARQDSDVEDNWGEAVEAFRDRQKWKQQGADRLKAAGFTDDQVRKWEKGDDKDGEDVTWSKRGQAREWDRGKVVDEDGDVDLKADWGRLK